MSRSLTRPFVLLLALSPFVALAQTPVETLTQANIQVQDRSQNEPLEMAITFDDLPAHGQRPPSVTRLQIAQSILDTLKQQQMPPVYGFINGVRTQEDPVTLGVLKAWRAAGEPLGNHTWSHPDLEGITPAEFEAEVEKNEPLLRQMMAGEDWHWFRYPFLHEGETTEKHREVRAWLKAHGYKVADVSMDFEDYLWNDPYTRCLAKGDAKSIEYLHDSYLATAASYIDTYRTLAHNLYGHDIPYVLLMHVGVFDAHMLPELLALYRIRGFSFISLPQAESDPAYADADFGYAGGGALTEVLTAKQKLKFPPNSKPYKQLDGLCR
jgi:peptidoglycan/xylan/chitin deacetylase (PgdA/CDA1 family)